jgi:phospholipid-binding lipoprotein MlaA
MTQGKRHALVSRRAVCEQASADPLEPPLRPRLFLALVGFGTVVGAVAPAWAGSPDDPWEHLNRRFYDLSMGADRSVFQPLARLYHALTPGPIGAALHNMVTNLSEPVVVANDVLQARIGRAVRDAARIVLDSTVGLGGMIDVGATAGLPHQDNDFGVTLGRWGVGPGPYLFVPVLGPSTVRDFIGTSADVALSPLNYVRFSGRLTLIESSTVVGGLDLRDRSEGDMQALLSGAADPYATLRSVYLQNRAAAIQGESATPALTPLDDEAPAPAAPQPSPPATPSAAASPPPAAVAPATELADDLERPVMTAWPSDRVATPTALASAGD